MKDNDVDLIERILAGEETAFTALVEKYQKPVHTLAWRKIGDFHIAEEITQDTFLKAYQRLHTLKDPHRFAGWLYVIATRRCLAWQRKKRMQTQPLADVETTLIKRDAYSQHIVEERAKIAAEAQREVVKKLLAKLKESERTVMTLHYLGEMTCEEISRFLGVSASTVKSRLRRARQRLQKEETMIKEALDYFQISPNLTNNIMREVARLKPAAPSNSKPLVPWTIAAASAILIVFMLGIGSQHLLRFQKPYSLDAQAEMEVNIIDAPVVLNVEVAPDMRNQLGSSKALGKSDNRGQRPDAILLAAAETEGEDISVPKQQWIQAEPIIGSQVEGLFGTSEGVLYAVQDAHLYTWQDDKMGWQQVGGDIRDYHEMLTETDGLTRVAMAEWDNTLYTVLRNLLLTSKDGGKTWEKAHSWAANYSIPYELVLTEQTFWVVFYKGAFRSEDKGKTWKDISDELPKGYIRLVATQNTVFAITYTGLYRWHTDSWERIELPVPEAIVVTGAAATKERLYVMASLGPDFNDKAAREGRQRTWWIFRSTDLGNSWQDITPTNAWPVKGWPPDIELIAAGETLLLIGKGMVRSTDGGDTWMSPQPPNALPMKVISFLPPAALNDRVFYAHSLEGLCRSTDGGKSWELAKITQDQARLSIDNLIVYKRREKMPPTLYGIGGLKIVKTTDRDRAWKPVQVEITMTAPVREDPPWIMQITTAGGTIYAKGGDAYPAGEVRLYRVSEAGNTLGSIQGMPTFDSRKLKDHLRKSQNLSIETLQKEFLGASQFFKALLESTSREQDMLIRDGFQGPFAVSDNTFYMEHNFKLLRWEPGATEWYDTKLTETVELSGNITNRDLKLAASGNTVYVGKRDGHLFVSFDRGDNWTDVTPLLPFPVSTFKNIVVAGTTVYVATDAGVIISEGGRSWRAVADAEGADLVMEHLAVDGTTLYGINRDMGIFRLESVTWKQIASEVLDRVTSLAVDGDTLYVGTANLGMLHYTLEK